MVGRDKCLLSECGQVIMSISEFFLTCEILEYDNQNMLLEYDTCFLRATRRFECKMLLKRQTQLKLKAIYEAGRKARNKS